MADLGDTFDPAAVPASSYNSDPIPLNNYCLQIVESEIAPLKTGRGKGLTLKIEVDGGDFHGRVIWDQLNIVHDNPETQAIAQRKLADYFLAVGCGPQRNTEEMHFRRFMGDVRIDKGSADYPPKNVIKRVRPMAGVTAPSAPPQQQSRPQAANTSGARPGSGSRPWAASKNNPDDDIPF